MSSNQGKEKKSFEYENKERDPLLSQIKANSFTPSPSKGNN